MTMTEHEWRTMDDEEAYPASNGKVCVLCGEVRLGWMGHEPEEIAGLLRPLRIEYIPPSNECWRSRRDSNPQRLADPSASEADALSN